MGDALADLIRAIVRETLAELAPHLAGGGEILPLARAAEIVGSSVRTLRGAAARGDLALEGPRAARVVRRAELDRWLAASGRRPPLPSAAPSAPADDHADARGAIARAASRVRRRTA